MSKDVFYLLGCGEHARSVADVICDNAPKARILFVDAAARPEERIYGFEVISQLPADALNICPARGDNRIRQELAEGLDLASVVSLRARVSPYAHLDSGVFIGCGAYVGPSAKVGRGSIVNTHAIVEHSSVVGAFCHIAPNATICGSCHIGDGAFIGAGVIVKDRIRICAGVTVGAGAVVVSDITQPGIYVGCPAAPLKRKEQ